MTEVTTTTRPFVGGPLDGQDAGQGANPYRPADGAAAPNPYGDDRLLRGRWQAGDTGVYSLVRDAYRWIGAPLA